MTRILILGAGSRGLAALLARCIDQGIEVTHFDSVAVAEALPMLLSRDLQPPPPAMAREPRQEAQWKSERRGRS